VTSAFISRASDVPSPGGGSVQTICVSAGEEDGVRQLRGDGRLHRAAGALAGGQRAEQLHVRARRHRAADTADRRGAGRAEIGEGQRQRQSAARRRRAEREDTEFLSCAPTSTLMSVDRHWSASSVHCGADDLRLRAADLRAGDAAGRRRRNWCRPA
jgi:hypothetical protein